MSYILEALKKAQAERQLGNAPDIHAPAPVHVPAAAATASRKPLLIGLGAGAVAAALLMGIVWRSNTPGGEPAVLAQASTTAGNMAVQGAAPPAAPAPAVPSVAVADVPPVFDTQVAPSAPPRASQMNGAAAVTPQAPPPVAAPAPPPAAARPAAPPASAASAAQGIAAASPAPAAARDAAPEAVYLPAPARAPEPPAAPARVADPVAEEALRTLQQLPEAIQREVPKIAVGGYIYSPNPADRLLLIDKTLRREGEEVAPGLLLERLMPKYAVMNYRGTRYRVAY